MTYQIQRVEINVFDFHLMLDPVNDGKPTATPFSFLMERDSYNQQYYSNTAISSTDLKFSPLNWRSLNYHHFWKYYQKIGAVGTKYDFFKIQMPFIGRSQIPTKLVTNSASFEGTVRPIVFLTSMGWSTNFDIKLRGQITPTDLQEFVAGLSKKSASVFEVAGKRMPLQDAFEYFGKLVLNAVYAPGSIDILRINRSIIVSLSQFTGPIAHYRPKISGVKGIPASDRAAFHSILLGKQVTFDELLQLENDKKFLATTFYGGPDFALTYFDVGTLLFMQQSAQPQGKPDRALRSKMKCHFSNLRNYLIMTYVLYNFCIYTKAISLADKAKTLRQDLVTTVQDIPNKYANEFSVSFHSNFGPLTKLK